MHRETNGEKNKTKEHELEWLAMRFCSNNLLNFSYFSRSSFFVPQLAYCDIDRKEADLSQGGGGGAEGGGGGGGGGGGVGGSLVCCCVCMCQFECQ